MSTEAELAKLTVVKLKNVLKEMGLVPVKGKKADIIAQILEAHAAAPVASEPEAEPAAEPAAEPEAEPEAATDAAAVDDVELGAKPLQTETVTATVTEPPVKDPEVSEAEATAAATVATNGADAMETKTPVASASDASARSAAPESTPSMIGSMLNAAGRLLGVTSDKSTSKSTVQVAPAAPAAPAAVKKEPKPNQEPTSQALQRLLAIDLSKLKSAERQKVKNRIKKLRGKDKKRELKNAVDTEKKEADATPEAKKEQPPADVEVFWVEQDAALFLTKPEHLEYASVMEHFRINKHEVKESGVVVDEDEEAPKEEAEENMAEDDAFKEEAGEDEEDMSNRKKKKMNRLAVANLKRLVKKPEVVEMWDVTAQDPVTLCDIKAMRHVVPVPRHWNQKRKYLQNKIGQEKLPFELPQFIKDTGIQEMRENLAEKEAAQKMAAKGREKSRPKMGKIHLAYNKLHDAFFRWQTKPDLTIYGDMYWENREKETVLKDLKPGNLSEELRTALGMTTVEEEKTGVTPRPPPWLINMQRYGPPPSYPMLKISGLNAPIPAGAQFGHQPGGWGRPPVDELGNPLYGNVFGSDNQKDHEKDVDKHTYFGAIEESSDDDDDDDDDDEDEDGGEVEESDMEAGTETPSGMSSVATGAATPDVLELRKRRAAAIEDAMTGSGKELYTIIPEQQSSIAGQVLGSTHKYDVAGATGADGVTVALDPENLTGEQYDDAVKAQYEAAMETQGGNEDLSDIVAENFAKQNKKRKGGDQAGNKSKKFKF